MTPKESIRISHFQKAAKSFYFIAIVSFTLCLLLNQPGYFRQSFWNLIITDVISFACIYCALGLYLLNKIDLKLAGAVYAYTTLADIGLSTWFLIYHHHFTANFLLGTFIYCINIVVAGFCVGRKHAFISASIYVFCFGPLIYVSRDAFLIENAITVLFLISAFALGVSGFLHVLERSHKEELALKEQVFEKDRALALKQNHLLNLDLELKQKEIVAKTIFLLEYARNNSTFIKKLNSIKEGMKSSTQKQLNDIIEKHRIENQEKYWKEFEVSFLEVHPEFYKKIYQICPDAKPTDLKLAALIRLGLSSKQIGNITSCTPESVDVARSRLRNKLNLSIDINLKIFLTNI
jgi:hypothetical protein